MSRIPALNTPLAGSCHCDEAWETSQIACAAATATRSADKRDRVKVGQFEVAQLCELDEAVANVSVPHRHGLRFVGPNLRHRESCAGCGKPRSQLSESTAFGLIKNGELGVVLLGAESRHVVVRRCFGVIR